MSLYHQNAEFFSKPYRLTPEQQAEPLAVIKEVFTKFKLHEAREEIARLLEVAISCENDEYSEPRERANAITICQQIELLLEAAYLLANEK